ncbi:MAG: histidine kinase [Oscillospiraceae bacterium]|nr:histidine kinase [Oscillospiraceae bacterium]
MFQVFSRDLVQLTPLLLQLAGLTFAVLIDPYIQKAHRRNMLLIIFVMLTLIAQNALDYYFTDYEFLRLARTIVAVYGYSFRPLVIVLFFRCTTGKRVHSSAWVLLGINAAVHLTAFFSDICFSFYSDGTFVRGPLGFTSHIVSGILLVQLAYRSIQEHHRIRRSIAWMPLFCIVLIVAGIIADTFMPVFYDRSVNALTMSTVTCCVFYYIWLHLLFVLNHEQALIEEQHIQIMISQIQPHFLFNTLSTIQALCRTDPEQAAQVTEKFGTYLRQNISSLNQPNLIPLEKELQHTKAYAEIEMIRFPNIQVEYDIQDSDFSLPALTIQPMVENAIRHGVRSKEEGIVRVSTRKTDLWHEILISDNGVGFDTSLPIPATKDAHIGLRNVRERIKTLCGGSVAISSRPNEGTDITIRIPLAKDLTRQTTGGTAPERSEA